MRAHEHLRDREGNIKKTIISIFASLSGLKSGSVFIYFRSGHRQSQDCSNRQRTSATMSMIDDEPPQLEINEALEALTAQQVPANLRIHAEAIKGAIHIPNEIQAVHR